MRSGIRAGFVGVVLGILLAGAAQAADPVEQHNSTAFWFINWIGLSNATLKVVAPNGEISSIYVASGTPVFELDRAKAMDGVYSYELTAATETRVKIVNPVDNGRGDNEAATMTDSFYLSGQFVVARGVITTPEELTEDSN
ncbi:hypothetical protein [Maliponia aquimaris]|nr:hypothetical protein [Maliponia aquimaris]